MFSLTVITAAFGIAVMLFLAVGVALQRQDSRLEKAQQDEWEARPFVACKDCTHYAEKGLGATPNGYLSDVCEIGKKEHRHAVTGKIRYEYMNYCAVKNCDAKCKDFVRSDTSLDEMEEYLREAIEERKREKAKSARNKKRR